jgi:signal peptidase I
VQFTYFPVAYLTDFPHFSHAHLTFQKNFCTLGRCVRIPKTVHLKPLFITTLLTVFFVGLWLIGKATSTLQLLRVKTPANQPALPLGKLIFTSNLKKPKQFGLICYRPHPAENARLPANRYTWLTHRLCGLPGDMLEIKAGILYINGVNADENLNLTHIFKVHRKDSSSIKHDPRQVYTIPPYSDILYMPLEDKYVQSQQLPCERYLLPPGLREDAIFKMYKRNWNQDNFGPVKVPTGKWFVLGDNRPSSIDSRHFGFIDQATFIGSIL